MTAGAGRGGFIPRDAREVKERKHIREAREQFLEGIGVPVAKPFAADAFQLEAIAALAGGHDTLVIAPTGAGKTFIAVEAIRRTVEEGKRAIYTAPLKALSNAKYAELKKRFEPEHTVGLLTGDRKIETDAKIVVATTEIYRNDLYGYSESYGLVVLDEFHYLADPQRGAVWEESIILSPRSSVLLMLSASISNPQEIAQWVNEVRRKEVQIVSLKERPVELRLGFLHTDLGVIPLQDEKGEVLPEISHFYSQADYGRGNFRGRRRDGDGGGDRRPGRRK